MPIKTHQDETPSLNLTPMIDVLFLLIIFFMVGTKFTDIEKKIALDVPEVSKTPSPDSPPKQTVVNVFRDGTVALDDDVMSIDKLASALAQRRKSQGQISVLIRGDAEGAFQNVASVLSACRQAGVSDLGVSVRVARKGD